MIILQRVVGVEEDFVVAVTTVEPGKVKAISNVINVINMGICKLIVCIMIITQIMEY